MSERWTLAAHDLLWCFSELLMRKLSVVPFFLSFFRPLIPLAAYLAVQNENQKL